MQGEASPLLLCTEVAEGGCVGHIPALPGLSFRGDDADALPALAPAHVARYADWLLAHGLADISPQAAAVVRCLRADRIHALQIVEAERLTGAPVWRSGNPAVLFESDRRPLSDADVQGHARFVLGAVEQMRSRVRDVPAEARQARATPDRRSLEETLTHVGHCIWWYCSRIDDDLPEPEEIAGEDPMLRILRLAPRAVAYLQAVPRAIRGAVHVPRRFPTRDAHEPWTHTKVCRRQAEHLWDHLPGVLRAAGAGS